MLPKNKAIYEFGLVFVSPAQMAELNFRYRHRHQPANVLSFVELSKKLPSTVLRASGAGDVVVCPQVVAAEAKRYGFTQKNWMTRLVVHAILHLAGYDHKTGKDRLKMERLEQIVLGRLKVY